MGAVSTQNRLHLEVKGMTFISWMLLNQEEDNEGHRFEIFHSFFFPQEVFIL